MWRKDQSPGTSLPKSLSTEPSWASVNALVNHTDKLNQAELISLIPKNPSTKVRLLFENLSPKGVGVF